MGKGNRTKKQVMDASVRQPSQRSNSLNTLFKRVTYRSKKSRLGALFPWEALKTGLPAHSLALQWEIIQLRDSFSFTHSNRGVVGWAGLGVLWLTPYGLNFAFINKSSLTTLAPLLTFAFHSIIVV